MTDFILINRITFKTRENIIAYFVIDNYRIKKKPFSYYLNNKNNCFCLSIPLNYTYIHFLLFSETERMTYT